IRHSDRANSGAADGGQLGRTSNLRRPGRRHDVRYCRAFRGDRRRVTLCQPPGRPGPHSSGPEPDHTSRLTFLGRDGNLIRAGRGVSAMSQVLDTLEITPVSGPIDATVRLPGSKSYTNRALVVAALASGESRIERALFSDDTRYMSDALRTLGIAVEARCDEEALLVRGAAGHLPVTCADLFVGNAGTAARFLTALVALGSGRYRIDGIARMRERPIGPLLNALRQVRVDVRSERGNDCPPIIVETTGLRGGPVNIDGGVSSQFISALMLVAPCTIDGITIN